MSLEDLHDHGVLLPEEEWGAHRVETTVSQGPLLGTLVLSAASLVLAYLGSGSSLTWFGLGGFFVFFAGTVWLCDRAIRLQRRRFESERSGSYEADGESTDSETYSSG